MRIPVLVSMLALAASPALASEICAWLPVAQVAKAFPEFGPWETMSGGKVGSCQFIGTNPGGVVVFGLNQMVQESAGKAQDLVAGMRRTLSATQRIEGETALGKLGFHYRPSGDADPGARNSLFLVGHRGRVVVLGSLTVPGDVTSAQRAAALQLAQAGFELAVDKEGLAAATRCPYFDRELLARLFKGASISEQVYGSNSCVAYAGKRVLMVAIVDDADAELASSMAASGKCTLDAVSDLGAQGSVGYACADGNARATVRYLQGNRHFQFDWVPGREPPLDERNDLVELARSAYGGH